jgi:hypothetical protein
MAPANTTIGRPKIFKSVEDIEAKIQLYKEYLKNESKPPTMAGLAYFLNVDRQTIYNYKKDREFFGTIKRYRDWVIMSIEEGCATKGHGGIIFLAKNYGYADKQQIDTTINSGDLTKAITKFVDKL